MQSVISRLLFKRDLEFSSPTCFKMSENPFGKRTAKIISRPVYRRKQAEKIKLVGLHESNAGFEVKVLNTTHFATRPAGEQRCGFVSVKTFNVIMCGVTFALLFTAFTPAQNLQSTLNETWGNYALGALYISLAISSIVGPLIVMKIGEKWSMMLGGATYIAWFAAQIKVVPWVLVCFSALNGFGAAILWTAQGAFLTKNSTKETMGRNSGIFFGFFQMNQVIGNLIAAAMLRGGGEYSSANSKRLFILFTVTSALSVLSFFLLKLSPADNSMIEPPIYHVTLRTRIKGIWKTLTDKKMLLLILIMAYSGLSQSFFSGSFTKELGRNLLNYVMTFFGVADALGSFMFGKVIDVLGRKPILLLATAMTMISTIMLLSFPREVLQQRTTVYYICAIMFGLGDAGVYTVLYATVGNLFITRVETAFGTFRLIQSLTTGIAFVVFLYVQEFSFQILIMVTLLLTGLLGYLFLDFFVADVDSQADSADPR